MPVNSRRLKSCEFKDVEECVLKWLKQCRDKKITIGGPILQEKAQQFAVELGHEKFRASNGWLQNFKKRNEIVFRKICGESGSVNETVCDDWKDKLAELTAGYDPEDIFNADETGLFYKCLPDKTLLFKGDECNGGKKAWMTSNAFSNWLQSLDKEMKKKNKKIIMFIDNCTAHGEIPKLKNIKIKYLPPKIPLQNFNHWTKASSKASKCIIGRKLSDGFLLILNAKRPLQLTFYKPCG